MKQDDPTADLWGKIIKRQYEEDEYNKIIGREDKAKANTTFGNRLRDQLKDNARIRALDDGSDAKMMREVNERYARIDAEQKKRVTDARERHKQFIENALEDIETKRIQREKDLDEEMYGSSMLIEKTKYLIAEDEKKQAELKEKALGEAEILEVFEFSKKSKIAGCMISSGKVTSNCSIRIKRNGELTFEGVIGSLKRFQNDASEVKQGQECGIRPNNFVDFEVGDVIESFIIEKISQDL